MTLAEWTERNPKCGVEYRQGLTCEHSVVVAIRPQPRPYDLYMLWHLDDFAVTSTNGSVAILTERL